MALMRNNPTFTLVFTFMFILFFSYLFLSSSIVAMEEGFNETVNAKGYPSDFAKANNWGMSEYVQWMIDWLDDIDPKYKMSVYEYIMNDSLP